MLKSQASYFFENALSSLFWQTAKRCQVVQSAPALRTPCYDEHPDETDSS